MYPNQEIQLQVAKIGWNYQIIDKTFPVKNPAIWFDDLGELIKYIKETYRNDIIKQVYGSNKIACIYYQMWKGEEEIIEKELKRIQS